MANSSTHRAFLRLLPLTPGQTPQVYSLSPDQEVVLGREPSCQIALDSERYPVVSRRHAVIRPDPTSGEWAVYDLDSANGTYVNGSQLQAAQILQPGDQLVLGQDGPEFVFDRQPAQVPIVEAAQPEPAPVAPLSSPKPQREAPSLPFGAAIVERSDTRLTIVSGLQNVLLELVVWGLVLTFLFPSLGFSLIGLFVTVRRRVTFDRRDGYLTITQWSLLSRLFNWSRPRRYALSDFVAVGLVREDYSDNSQRHLIYLELESGERMRPPIGTFNRQSAAQQLADFICDYLPTEESEPAA